MEMEACDASIGAPAVDQSDDLACTRTLLEAALERNTKLELLLDRAIRVFCVPEGNRRSLYAPLVTELQHMGILKGSTEGFPEMFASIFKDKITDSHGTTTEVFWSPHSCSRFSNEYDVLGKLGKGSFSDMVYKARSRLDQNVYAVKVIGIPKEKNKDQVDSIIGEARRLSSMNHPNVVRYYSSWCEFEEDFETPHVSPEGAPTYQRGPLVAPPHFSPVFMPRIEMKKCSPLNFTGSYLGESMGLELIAWYENAESEYPDDSMKGTDDWDQDDWELYYYSSRGEPCGGGETNADLANGLSIGKIMEDKFEMEAVELVLGSEHSQISIEESEMGTRVDELPDVGIGDDRTSLEFGLSLLASQMENGTNNSDSDEHDRTSVEFGLGLPVHMEGTVELVLGSEHSQISIEESEMGTRAVSLVDELPDIGIGDDRTSEEFGLGLLAKGVENGTNNSDSDDRTSVEFGLGLPVTPHMRERKGRTLYIAMELCACNRLSDHLDDLGKFTKLPRERVFLQLLQGISHVHSLQIVHHDLAPKNVLLDDDLNVKIADFGLSGAPATKPGCWRGTKPYIAPEVLHGVFTTKADIFAIGLIGLQLLEFGLNDEVLVNRKIPETICNAFPDEAKLLARMIDDDRNHRPSADEAISMLSKGGYFTAKSLATTTSNKGGPESTDTSCSLFW